MYFSSILSRLPTWFLAEELTAEQQCYMTLGVKSFVSQPGASKQQTAGVLKCKETLLSTILLQFHGLVLLWQIKTLTLRVDFFSAWVSGAQCAVSLWQADLFLFYVTWEEHRAACRKASAALLISLANITTASPISLLLLFCPFLFFGLTNIPHALPAHQKSLIFPKG